MRLPSIMMETVEKEREHPVNSEILKKGGGSIFCFALTKLNISSLLLKINVSACAVILEHQRTGVPKINTSEKLLLLSI